LRYEACTHKIGSRMFIGVNTARVTNYRRHEAEVSLTYKPAYPVRKEYIQLLPKSLTTASCSRRWMGI